MKLSLRWIARAATASLLIFSVVVASGQEKPAKVSVALLGVAHLHTPGFIQMVKARDDVQVKYVWDADPKRAKASAEELGAKAAQNLEQVWADPQVVGVAIFSETNRHRDLVLGAAKAHKHLFVEKPLGINARECDEMARAIEQAGVLFTTGYFNRGLPINMFLKEEIAKGNFGKITRVRASNCHDAVLADALGGPWRWMADPKIAGTGGFGDLGTHMIDLLMWMLGDVDSVTAELRSVVGRYGDADETGEAMLRFHNGTIGTVAAGWVDIENPVTLLISGTEGHAVVVNGRLYYKSNKVPDADGRRPWNKKMPRAQPHPYNMFLDAMAGQKGLPMVSAKDAATRVRVMEAIYQAAKQHAWVAPQ